MVLRARSEVPEDETWDLRPLFESDTAFESCISSARLRCEQFEDRLDRTVKHAEDLASLFHDHDEIVRIALDVGRYASARFAEDATAVDAQKLMANAEMFQSLQRGVSSQFDTKILSIGKEVLLQWSELPVLRDYRGYLTRKLNELEHRLSDEAEGALSAMTSIGMLPANIYQTAIGADIQFESVLDSDGQEVAVTPFYMLLTIETSTDTALRHRAYESLTNGLRPYQHTLAKSLAESIRHDVALSRLRKYPTVFHMLQSTSPDPSFAPNDVSPEHMFMVQDLIFKGLTPHMQRYMRLRQRVLGLEKPLLCDTKAPLESLQGERIPFAQAKEIILSAAEPLGDTYQTLLSRAFDERWIYSARNIGNWNGAFCGESSVHPYVFSPYGEQLYDTFILGHELGHAVHLALSVESQRPTNLAVSGLFVETPSTLMEHMIGHYLRQRTDDERVLRKSNMLQLFSFHHDFVTHQTEAEILKRLYAMADDDEPLSTDTFKTVSRQVLTEFWGDTIDLDEGADLYWMRQPHYYMGLYTYTYAVGLVASTVLARRIPEEGERLVRPWIEVLKSGANINAIDMFKMVGIDMASPEPYEEAVQHVGRLIDELERSYT